MSDIRDKISKLLAMATHERSNEHEAETAMRLAEKLMRIHNIELADLEDSTGKQTVYTWRSITIPVGEFAKPMSWFPMWSGYQALAVARFTDCKIERALDLHYGQCVKFMGDETDIEYCAWLFKKLRDFGWAESKSVPGVQRDTFCKSYALQLTARMETIKAQGEAELRQAVTKSGTALMVVQNKIALRDSEFGKQKVRNSRAKLGSKGFVEGRAAADRASFNRPIGNSSEQRQLA
jgi:hypothetical protein